MPSLLPHDLCHEWNASLAPGTFPSPGELPNPGIEPRSPALQEDSLPAEPQGKPKNTVVGSLALLRWIFLTQESNWCLLHCRWILYQLSYEGSPESYDQFCLLLFSGLVVSDSVTPWTAACQVSLSFTISQSLPKLMSIESVMPSNHLILCHPLLLPSIFPRIKVFSSESALLNRWPKY